ncbi:hypothetical protein J7E50_25855, partial [Pedobacter sp. ISL-68]|uniref:hypothetical protein n=1 Tax=unclassified Pedobacter TaxID=2628915 RepID=UPI001BEBFD45
MKKRLLLGFSFMLATLSVNAQQKIKDGTISNGNLASKDALLELESNNKGLLHARVALIESTNPLPLSMHIAGMMVYNIAKNADVVPGIYYNDGSKWVFVKGNTGTIKIENHPGETGAPRGIVTGVTIVKNDSGTWIYNPETGEWTNISGLKGDKGDTGAAG